MSFDEEYDSIVEPLDEFGKRIANLLEDLLRGSQIEFHSVRYRVKRKESASRKLSTQGGEYWSVGELRDMLGVRVITHFADHVGAVGKLVRSEFETDPKRSVDKGKLLDPDRFGYLSLHYIAELTSSRLQLAEWRRFAGLSFEVQVRSILQHSWAEIEHDLGYKSPIAIPAKIRRRFSRLAGVLELADDEFQAIRIALENHAKDVDSSVKAGRSTPIDQDSIQSLVTSSPIVCRIDQMIAARWNMPLDVGLSSGYAAHRAEELLELGVQSTNEVLRLLTQDEPKIVKFADEWFKRPDRRHREPFSSLSPGISLFYLYLHLSLKLGAAPPLEMFEDGDRDSRLEFQQLHDSIFNA